MNRLTKSEACGRSAVTPYVFGDWGHICPEGYICIEWDEYGESLFYSRKTNHMIVKHYDEIAIPGDDLPIWVKIDEYNPL